MQTHAGEPRAYRPPTPMSLKTPREAALILRVSLHTLYAMIYQRQLKAAKCGRQWRISDRSLREFLGENEETES